MRTRAFGACVALSFLPSCGGEGWEDRGRDDPSLDTGVDEQLQDESAGVDEELQSEVPALELGQVALALSADGKCECGAQEKKQKSFWDDYFSAETQTLWKETFKLASDIAGTYTSVMGYVDAAISMAETLGLLEQSVSIEQVILDRLNHIEETLGTVDSFVVSSEYLRRKNDTYPYAIDALSRAQLVRNWVIDNGQQMSEELALDSGILPDVLSDLDQLTTNPSHFERAAHLVRDPHAGNARHDDQNPGDTQGDWKKFIPDRPPVVDGVVWEWRIGLPSLMRATAASVEVLTAIYPNIAQSSIARTELMSYRARLIEIRDQLLGGIRCGFTGAYDPANNHYGARSSGPTKYDFRDGLPMVTGMCVDIYSGTSGLAQKVASDGHFPPTSTANYMIKADLAAFIPHALDDAYAQLKIKLGLFEIQQMIDRLYTLANDSPAPVVSNGRLPSFGIPGMCLGSSGDWAQTVACSTRVRQVSVPNPLAQGWRFNAVSGELVHNGGFGNIGSGESRCLGVMQYLEGDVLTRAGSWAGLAECDGREEQRWTYDPEQHVLQNALGRVLDVEWGNTAEHTWIWTWDYNLTGAQLWGP